MSKILVAFFSATGTTEAVAKKLAKAVDGDIFEILPVVPYTVADLDWKNPNSRTSLEMKDKSSRPPIVGRVEDITKYDTLFIGFPVWWYVAPTVINSFLESYDLTDKTVIPFATSGSSDMGKTNEELLPSCPDSILKEGKRFSPDVTVEELKAWAEALTSLGE